MQRRRLLLACALLLAAPHLASAEAKKEEKKKSGGTSYLQMNVLTASLPRADRRRSILTVEVGIDIPDAKLRAKAETILPRLRAAYVQTLQIYAGGLPADFPPNADRLAQLLQRDTDLTLGQKGARLLLGTILIN